MTYYNVQYFSLLSNKDKTPRVQRECRSLPEILCGVS
jgi:hypothetical protein